MNEKKKRSFVIAIMLTIMTLVLCIVLISCGDDEKTDRQQGEIKTEQKEEVKNEKKDVDDEREEEANQEDVVKESQKALKSETEKATQKATNATTQKVAQETTQGATTEVATQAKTVCYITIEGYCSGKEISLQEGDTAYSILCKSGARVSGSSNYIKGINGRFEFDEGPASGWVYYINGSKPSVGCGSCSVKAGDSIKWVYVTSY